MESGALRTEGLPKQDQPETGVPADDELCESNVAVPGGPKKVFKRGYPTTTLTSLNSAVEMEYVEGADLVALHGAADPAQVRGLMCPKGVSPLMALASQNAYLVTNEYKVVDVAASVWPIDVAAAPDVRAVASYPVKFGDILGVVAGSLDDITIVQARESIMVPTYDLQPLIVNRSIRTGGA